MLSTRLKGWPTNSEARAPPTVIMMEGMLMKALKAAAAP